MQRALVIGASGGIGAALSAALEARGAAVTCLSRSEDGLDVTDAASVDRILGALEAPFDVIIVATGILAPPDDRPEKSLDAINPETMAAVLAANTIGPALILRHLPRLMPATGRSIAAVLTARVGSIGDNKLGGWYSYRASKAAANQIVHTAAIEIRRMRKQSIVVALHPGTVDTDFTSGYPGHRKVTAPEAAENILGVIDGLTPAQTGAFFDWAGEEVPW